MGSIRCMIINLFLLTKIRMHMQMKVNIIKLNFLFIQLIFKIIAREH